MGEQYQNGRFQVLIAVQALTLTGNRRLLPQSKILFVHYAATAIIELLPENVLTMAEVHHGSRTVH
jgi:hypothetical protein